MQYHCIYCSTTLKRSEVERFPDQPPNTEYRKHTGCKVKGNGTAILVGVLNPNWTDGEENVSLEEWLKDH